MDNCKRGDLVRLSLLRPLYWIEFEWDQDIYMDTDIMAIILSSKGQVIDEGDIVFYNNPQSSNEALCISNDDSRSNWEFIVDFSRLPPQAQRIVFVHTIYDAGVRRQTVSQIKNCVVTVKQKVDEIDFEGEKEAIYSQVGENPPQELLIICELRKVSGSWFFVPLSNGFDGDLESLCSHYGMTF